MKDPEPPRAPVNPTACGRGLDAEPPRENPTQFGQLVGIGSHRRRRPRHIAIGTHEKRRGRDVADRTSRGDGEFVCTVFGLAPAMTTSVTVNHLASLVIGSKRDNRRFGERRLIHR